MSRVRASMILALVIPVGCGGQDDLPEPPALVSVSGVVTLDGKPLPGAVVTFLPVDERGTLAVSDTGLDGAYRLTYMGAPGAAAAGYKVAVSYLVAADGKPLGLAPRSSLAPVPGLADAQEWLPPEASDLGRTGLRATVPPGGGVIDWPLKGPLRAPPPAGGTPTNPVPGS